MLSLWALAAHLQMGELMALCEVSRSSYRFFHVGNLPCIAPLRLQP